MYIISFIGKMTELGSFLADVRRNLILSFLFGRREFLTDGRRIISFRLGKFGIRFFLDLQMESLD